MNLQAIKAIFWRNFAAYFANPTGYVFICAFVLASGFAAFWPHEFFNSNLANLDQLNRYLPYVMLGFTAAITMSLWAEERRQGTDELLLTLPAGDLDVVVAKFLAAVAIFSVSLVFSLTNLVVLRALGQPDLGLMFSTYVGYWMVGVAMLSIGMVASFLTANLTVGFILGMLFNAPLVLAASADLVVPQNDLTQWIKSWSVMAEFGDFARGVISASSLAYFGGITGVMLYLSMVLIGRRRWNAGNRGARLAGHFAVRSLSLMVAGISLVALLRVADVRVDASSEKLSSLSPQTMSLLRDIRDKRRVHIEAYVSPEGEVPEAYVTTRLNLLTAIDELVKRGGGRITARINETESFRPEATIAEQRFGITGQTVYTRDRGKYKESRVYMGVAITSGLDKVVIPFFDRGIPAEYELVRSIVSLASAERKTLGLVTTDVPLTGRPNPHMGGAPGTPSALMRELEKQYEVKVVDPAGPIDGSFDVLVVAQPSSLNQIAVDNLVAKIRSGQPTVIFEDPLSFIYRDVPGTAQPKQPPGGNPFMGMPPSGPKSSLTELWDLLGVTFDGVNVIAQGWNPFPTMSSFPPEFVFIGRGSGQTQPFSRTDPISSGLQHVMLLCPGSFTKTENSPVTFEPLLQTGPTAARLSASTIFLPPFLGGGFDPNRRYDGTRKAHVMAARIRGGPAPAGGSEAGTPRPLHVVLVADVDVLSDPFFNIRTQGPNPDMDMHLDVDNVTFVLNAIDALAGDSRFIDIRKRRREHRTLTVFESRAIAARQQVAAEQEKFRQDFERVISDEEEKINRRVNEIARTPGIDQRQFDIQLETARAQLEKSLSVRRRQLEEERDRKIRQKESETELEIRKIQHRIKLAAVFVPPVAPLLIGAFLFVKRRRLELEGASEQRVRR